MTADAVREALEYTCPFCGDDDFDEVGLCLHLSGGCAHYDRACRRTADELERRFDAYHAKRAAMQEPQP